MHSLRPTDSASQIGAVTDEDKARVKSLISQRHKWLIEVEDLVVQMAPIKARIGILRKHIVSAEKEISPFFDRIGVSRLSDKDTGHAVCRLEIAKDSLPSTKTFLRRVGEDVTIDRALKATIDNLVSSMTSTKRTMKIASE